MSQPGPAGAIGRLRARVQPWVSAAYDKTRGMVRYVMDTVTRRTPASVPYRFLARQLANRLAGVEGPKLVVFSTVGSLVNGSDVLTMMAYFLRAELGARVLIVDGTFRADGVSRRFELSRNQGLSEWLRHSEVSSDAFVCATQDPGVFLMPAGSPSEDSPVSESEVRSLFDHFGEFDFVLLQQGSIALDTRYLPFLSCAHQVLLFLEEGTTKVSEFELSQKLFRDYGIANVGLLMSEAGE